MLAWQKTILARLTRYSGHKLSYDAGSISVLCDNPESDDVSIWGDEGAFIVSFGGWHEHFDDLEDAKNCFAFCLTGPCRLKVTFRGDTESTWTLQTREAGGWEDGSTTGLLFIPFWKPKRYEFRHNVLLLKA